MAEAAPVTPPVNPRYQQLVDDLWNDSELGPKVRAKAKEKWADIRIPDEQVTPLVKPLQERMEAIEKENKELKEARAKEAREREEKEGQAQMEARLDAARKKYALTDESFDKMVARMKETHNYTDAEAAAAWVTDHLPPPPAPTSGPSWAVQYADMYGTKKKNDNWALLHKDSEAWLDTQIGEVLKESNAA